MLATLVLFLTPRLSAQSQPESSSRVLIEGGTLVDVRRGAQIRDRAILIEGGRIQQIGVSGVLRDAPNTRLVDARGKWIIPGLIDMHVHGSARKEVSLALYVANGVTAIRDLGGNLAALRLAREYIESEKRLGPRLFFVGEMLDGNPPVWPPLSIIVDTPARAKSAVNHLVDQGADSIKVYNRVSEPVLEAVILAARSHGVPVVGHVPQEITASRAAELGMDVIEHSAIRARDLVAWDLLTVEEAAKLTALSSPTQREALVWEHVDLDSGKLRALISDLAQSRTFLDPTLSVDEWPALLMHDEEARLHPNNRFVTRSVVEESLGPEHDIFRVPPELRPLAAAGIEKKKRFIGKCNRAGVRIVAGTDGPGIAMLVAGYGLHHELGLLVQSGLRPLEALQAATINAARALRKDHELGTIEPGRLADIVILEADPLADIGNTRKVTSVVLGGRVFDRQMLDRLLAQAEADAGNEP